MTLLYRDLMRTRVRGGSHLWIDGTLSSELTNDEFFGVEPEPEPVVSPNTGPYFMADIGRMMMRGIAVLIMCSESPTLFAVAITGILGAAQ